ncbi:MAG: hypothetical protein QOI89_3285, partial [Solirubrobacteraceae bacterium]|nr:hypothetical protein [Solirubrobacteraceae bacterium]
MGSWSTWVLLFGGGEEEFAGGGA